MGAQQSSSNGLGHKGDDMLDTTITAKFDVTGQADGTDMRASRQWAMRPMDQRMLSIQEMIDKFRERQFRSEARTLRIGDIRPMLDDAGEMAFDVGGRLMAPTNYAFNQWCQAVDVPAGFLTGKLGDAPRLAVDCIDHCLRRAENPNKEIGILEGFEDGLNLRAVTGKDYGRIWDLDVAMAIQRATQESGAIWSVPTAFRTANGAGAFGRQYECIDPTKEDTTLYASDRDQFGFEVDERNPIEAGRLPNGDPDLYFRGFYWWNGECGGVSNGIGTFLYRYVCCNRIIWGQKEYQRISIRHTKNAMEKFVKELIPALKLYVNGSATGIVTGLEAARRAKIARDDAERTRFLSNYGFGTKEVAQIMGKCIDEEGRPIETVFDAVQAITAWARGIGNADRRVEVERTATKLMALAA
jgi:hypothetical protein